MSVPASERLVFSHVLEGLYFRALKGRVTPRFVQRLRAEADVDLEKPLKPGYSHATWTKCLQLTAQELFPGQPEEQALQQIGATLTKGYFDTIVGGALAAMLRVLGPARAVKRMDRSLRSGNNYSECRVTELGPGKVTMWTNESGPLRYNMLGVIRQGAEIAGAKNLKVAITNFDDESVTFDLSWDA